MTRNLWLCAALAVTGAALLVEGCSSSTTGTLDGEVTLDGNVLKEGVVSFEPEGGKGTTKSENITDGKFRVSLAAGEYRVRFSAPKPGPKRKVYDTPESPWVEDVGELIPEKHNAKSDWKVAIQSGTQAKKFELTSR